MKSNHQTFRQQDSFTKSKKNNKKDKKKGKMDKKKKTAVPPTACPTLDVSTIKHCKWRQLDNRPTDKHDCGVPRSTSTMAFKIRNYYGKKKLWYDRSEFFFEIMCTQPISGGRQTQKEPILLSKTEKEHASIFHFS